MLSKDNEERQPYVGATVDWWTIGVLMVEMLTGLLPFSAPNGNLKLKKILSEKPEILKNISQDANDLIQQLLEKNPEQRLGYKNGANDLKSHQFFGNVDWKKMTMKLRRPPMVPAVTGKYDFKYFDDAIDETIEIDDDDTYTVHNTNTFNGYYFVSPALEEFEIQNNQFLSLAQPDKQTIENIRAFSKDKRSKFFKKYRIMDVIEKGSFSVCVRSAVIATGSQVAVKVMKLSHNAKQEIAFLMECQGHKNIVKLIEVLRDSHYQYLVFELLSGGDLHHRQIDVIVFEEPLAKEIFQQMIEAVEFIHSKGIVHRDLKVENFVFLDDKVLKLIDFGFAHKTSTENANIAVSFSYAAPESLKFGPVSTPRDIWSLGVILFRMLCGHMPFASPNNIDDSTLIKIIMSGKFTQSSNGWRNLSKSAKDLINKLLKVNETERLTIKQILEHPWLNANIKKENALQTVNNKAKVEQPEASKRAQNSLKEIDSVHLQKKSFDVVNSPVKATNVHKEASVSKEHVKKFGKSQKNCDGTSISWLKQKDHDTTKENFPPADDKKAMMRKARAETS